MDKNWESKEKVLVKPNLDGKWQKQELLVQKEQRLVHGVGTGRSQEVARMEVDATSAIHTFR